MSPRKIFVLATSLVPILGAACGGGVDAESRGNDGGADAGWGPPRGVENDEKPDARLPSNEGSPGVPGECPEIDATRFPWKPPTLSPGSCTEAELDAFVSFVAKTDDPQKWKDGPWTSNDGCRDCVFAKETASWPPMILNASGQLADLNVGGCIAIASGIEACGKAYSQWRSCYQAACRDISCNPGNNFAACVSKVNATACKKAFDAVHASCGSAQVAADAETACDGEKYVFEGPIRAQCIGLGDGDL